jgi:hypothetical protein
MAEIDNKEKWQISLLSGLVFLLISAPALYKLTDMVGRAAGLPLASETGCPTLAGLLLHTIVFVLVTRLLMM